MSKKQHHKQSHRVPAPAGITPAPPAAVETAPRIVSQRTPAVAKPKSVVTWQDMAVRYQHVNEELKRIGILAGSFLVVLLVLWAILG